VRRLVACALVTALATAVACSFDARRALERKLVVIALDGMDPHLVARWTGEGKLPALARLAARNGLHQLQSVPPPAHGPAWATLATGLNPGKHGLFDQFARDPATYQPRAAPATAAWPFTPEGHATFWSHAARAGVRYTSTDAPRDDIHLRLPEEAFEESTFLDRVRGDFDDRAGRLVAALASRNWDLLLCRFDGVDRVQHLMWRLFDDSHPMFDQQLARRYGKAIEQIYQRADALIGDVLDRVGRDTAVVIVSAYGFAAARSSVSLNSWLVERGYMHLYGPSQRSHTTAALAQVGLLDNVDWTRTRAYSIGFGQLYVNLKGRERHGVIAAGAEREVLLDSLIIDLMSFLDPHTQSRVVASVYKPTEIFDGPHVERAPDLLVGLEPGYYIALPSALGATPAHAVEPNLRQWSGDHSSFDYKTVPGLLLATSPVTSGTVRLVDIAPTVLRYFGVEIPAAMDGKPIF
jgi:predicted AlkP superfamily phosphohydrolase/phosphomutase